MKQLQFTGFFTAFALSLSVSALASLPPQGPGRPAATTNDQNLAGDFINLYAVSIHESKLYRIDGFTGTVFHEANLVGISGSMGALEYHLDGNYYAITVGPTPELYRIDALTYETSLVGPLGLPFFEGGLAIGPDGQAWAVAGNLNAPFDLLSINLATGQATVIGSLGMRDFNGLDLRSDGMLVGIESITESLYVIDPNTAAQTLLAPLLGEPGIVGGLVIRDNVGYYVTGGPGFGGSDELYSFDIFSGTSTLIGALTDAGQTVGGFSGLASPNPIFYSKYCVTSTNSTGLPGILEATGSRSSSAGDLQLHAIQIPNQFGIFFHGGNFTQVPFGCSNLCTTVDIRRSPVVQSAGNYVSYTYDNQDSAHSLANYVGSVRHFQYWFRDPMNLGQCGFTFNLSDAFFMTVFP